MSARFWTAVASAARHRFRRADHPVGFKFIVRPQAPSPLRSAGALQNRPAKNNFTAGALVKKFTFLLTPGLPDMSLMVNQK